MNAEETRLRTLEQKFTRAMDRIAQLEARPVSRPMHLGANDTDPLLPADGNLIYRTDTDQLRLRLDGAWGNVTAWNNKRVAKTADYTVVNGDAGRTLALGGTAFFTLTFGAASGYDGNFAVLVVNEDTGRAKTIAPNGLTSFLLWPGQSTIVFNQNSVWKYIPAGRWKLTGSTTFYVDGSNGASTNDGLATGTGAFATIQQVWDAVAKNVDIAGQTCTIQCATGGTLTAGLAATIPLVGGGVTIDGNTSTVSTTSANCISINTRAAVTVKGFTLSTTTSGHCVRSVNPGANVTITTGMVFSTCAGSHIRAESGGFILVNNSYTVSGNAAIHYQATAVANILIGGTITVTVSGTPAFSTAFVRTDGCSALTIFGTTYSGSATGTRYSASLNSTINTFGSGATYFPGNVGGATATGGQYA